MTRSRVGPFRLSFRLPACSRRLAAALGALAVFWHAEASTAASVFLPLGDLSGGAIYSYATAVSDDGRTVVGTSTSTSGDQAFRWTIRNGMVGLGDLPGGAFYSRPEGVSADGSTIVGNSTTAGGASGAFRWTPTDGIVALGVLPGMTSSAATGVSDDGSTIAGHSGDQAFLWTSAGGIVALPVASGVAVDDLSADGSTVVGRRGIGSGSLEAFRWTSATGIEGLGDLPGGVSSSIARAVSADGSIIVGSGQSSSGLEAFRWTSATGMVGLGDLPGGVFSSYALATSADGTIVVGAGSSSGGGAFLWDAEHGMRAVSDVLTDLGIGSALTGWTLTAASGISADGRVIVGQGINPSGNVEGWFATIPEPGTGVLLGIGLVWLGSQRRASLRRAARRCG